MNLEKMCMCGGMDQERFQIMKVKTGLVGYYTTGKQHVMSKGMQF